MIRNIDEPDKFYNHAEHKSSYDKLADFVVTYV